MRPTPLRNMSRNQFFAERCPPHTSRSNCRLVVFGCSRRRRRTPFAYRFSTKSSRTRDSSFCGEILERTLAALWRRGRVGGGLLTKTYLAGMGRGPCSFHLDGGTCVVDHSRRSPRISGVIRTRRYSLICINSQSIDLPL